MPDESAPSAQAEPGAVTDASVESSSGAPIATPGDGPGAPKTPRSRIHTYPTVRLDSRELQPSWPIAIASLEQLAAWPVLALRLGTLALIQAIVRELAEPDARADLVVRLRDLVDALAHMPLEA